MSDAASDEPSQGPARASKGHGAPPASGAPDAPQALEARPRADSRSAGLLRAMLDARARRDAVGPEDDRPRLEVGCDAYDAAAAATPLADRFCSSTAWVLPARDAFHESHPVLLVEAAEGFAALAAGVADDGARYYSPLEAMWGLASPLVGPDPEAVAEALVAALLRRRQHWDLLWLSGLDARSPQFRVLVRGLGRRYRLGLGPKTMRHTASLTGGLDGFLGRRSSKFRANLRRALRRADAFGLTFERVVPRTGDEGAALHARTVDVESRSWKGVEGVGVAEGAMHAFYAAMLPRLAGRGRLRGVLARLGDEDVGYVVGAVFAGEYRGLQVSFDDRFRQLALGNVLQAKMIQTLCEEGVTVYDLGSDIDYKRRWAEGGLETVPLVVMP